MNDYEIINGKPHLGCFYGHVIFINAYALLGDIEKNPYIQENKDYLESWANKMTPKDLEIRHKQYIVKPPYFSGTHVQNGSIAIKFMVWGRAFKVMKLFRNGIKRYKKKLVNGRRRFMRCDRNGMDKR